MVSVLLCTEHVDRNFSYKLLKLSKSIIDSLVRILFNEISRKKQVELLFLKEGINSTNLYTATGIIVLSWLSCRDRIS